MLVRCLALSRYVQKIPFLDWNLGSAVITNVMKYNLNTLPISRAY